MKKAFLVFALLTCACGSGPCREKKDAAAANQEVQVEQNKPGDRVRVYKADGSLQCGQGKAIPVDEMKKSLKDIQVFSAENKPDGLMHIQACGTPTGRCNVYEINRTDLEKAKKAGFKEWTWE